MKKTSILKDFFNFVRNILKPHKKILKFLCISLLSFGFDYIFYIIFNIFFKNIFFANILARIISSSLNYNLNKKLVFKRKNKTSIIRYYLLAIIILTLNTSLLGILVNYLAINKFIAKLFVELLLFILSYLIQKKFVFKSL